MINFSGQPTIDNQRTKAQGILQKIQQWPYWNEIVLVAQKEYGLSPDKFLVLLPEYQRFLTLIMLGNQTVSMCNEQIDKLWHAHILHTIRYEEFCLQFVGHMIHHRPNLQMQSSSDNCESPETPQPPRICESPETPRPPKTCESPETPNPTEPCDYDKNPHDQGEGGKATFISLYEDAFGEISPIWGLQ